VIRSISKKYEAAGRREWFSGGLNEEAVKGVVHDISRIELASLLAPEVERAVSCTA
jgi:hypothetical protein